MFVLFFDFAFVLVFREGGFLLYFFRLATRVENQLMNVNHERMSKTFNSCFPLRFNVQLSNLVVLQMFFYLNLSKK